MLFRSELSEGRHRVRELPPRTDFFKLHPTQIKDRKYALKFVPRLAEQKKYTGKILAVGIGYEKTEKKHRCRVESLN